MTAPLWYCASALFTTVLDGDPPDKVRLVEERIYLIQNDDVEDIWDKASRMAREESTGTKLEFDGQPACVHFVGIRKVVSVRSHICQKYGSEIPSDGCELTFSFFKLKDKFDINKLVSGEQVDLTFEAD